MGPLAIAGLGMGGLGLMGGAAKMMSGGPDYGQLIQLLQKHFGPQQLQQGTQQMYQMGLGSPGFQQQLQGINSASNQFNQNLGARLGQQGFGGGSVRSGVGTIGQAAAPSLSSSTKGSAYGQLWNQSQQMAMQQMLAQMQALQGMQAGPTWGQSFGNLLGSGMQAGGQYLALQGLRQPAGPKTG